MVKSIKRITLAGTRMYNYDDSVAEAFKGTGFEVDTIHYKRLPTFFENQSVFRFFHNYFNKLAYKEYLRKIHGSVAKSDLLLFFGRNKLLNYHDVVRIREEYNVLIVFWLIDSINSTTGWQDLFKSADLVVCYNKDEVEILLARSIKAIFLPLAFDTSYYFPEISIERDIDVYFVGSLSSRMNFLDEVAQRLTELNISFLIDGKLTFLKRINFVLRGKYCYFRKCASFRNRTHKQINYYSNRAKICLNIQPVQATSALNIRTYEILGTGAFQITNSTPILELFFKDEYHLVVYNDLEDLISKIKYYIFKSEIRKQTANNGYMAAIKSHTFKNRIKEIIDSLKQLTVQCR